MAQIDRRVILNEMRVLSSKLAAHAVTIEEQALGEEALALNQRIVDLLAKEQDMATAEAAFNRLLGLGKEG